MKQNIHSIEGSLGGKPIRRSRTSTDIAESELVWLNPGPQEKPQVRPLNPPPLRKGQVQLKLLATSVNPIDVKRAHGYGQRLFRLIGAAGKELVLGNDFVGKVLSTAPDVNTFRPGDLVFGTVPTGKDGGAHRSVLTVDAALARRLPAGVDPVQAGVLPYTFCTLWQALKSLGLRANTARGKRILIQGGSGALGQLATQLLSQWGAHVTVVASQRHAALCQSLGAKCVVDRHVQRVDDLPSDFDATLNFGDWENDPPLVRRLAPNALGHATAVHPLVGDLDRYGWIKGAMTAFGQWRKMNKLARSRGKHVRYAWTLFKPDGEALDLLADLLGKGRIKLDVAVSIPFSQAKSAFDHVEKGGPTRAALIPD